jgi:hypothetical protein
MHNDSGIKGFLTAAHCGNTQSYFGYNGQSYATTFKAELNTARKDMQWHSTASGEFAEFYANSTTARRQVTSATGWADQAEGSVACHRGQTTGYSCGTITDKTFQTSTCNGNNPCEFTWVRVEGGALACSGGDSGGPWFLGNSAYGIHHSGASAGTAPGQCNFAVFSPIDFKTDLGLSILLA